MKEERQAPTGKGRPAAMKTAQAKATPIADIEVVGEDRRLTHIGEFDRVLGGGVIPGSVILINGWGHCEVTPSPHGQEIPRRVMRTENQNSVSYADQSNYC